MNRLILCLLLALGLSGGARAAVLLDQPLVFIDGRASHVAGGSSGFITYDRITLAQAAAVDRVTWIGAFIDTANLQNNPVAPVATSWTLQVAQDAAGVPGAVSDSVSLAFADVAATLLGSATLAGQPVFYYAFSALLADPLYVAGGTAQWFAVFSEDAAADPRFAWLSGSGGDGVARQQFLANGSWTPYTDRALRLEGNVVPEPATAWLLAMALLLGVVGVRRR